MSDLAKIEELADEKSLLDKKSPLKKSFAEASDSETIDSKINALNQKSLKLKDHK